MKIQLFEQFVNEKNSEQTAYIKMALNDNKRTVDNSYEKMQVKSINDVTKSLIKDDKINFKNDFWIQALIMLGDKFYSYESGITEETTKEDFDNSFGPKSTELDSFE